MKKSLHMPTKKLYKAKSLRAAEREVRRLRKHREDDAEIIRQYRLALQNVCAERRILAKLAAKGPCFDNPLAAMEAETLRDRVLRSECRLTPEGKHIQETADVKS